MGNKEEIELLKVLDESQEDVRNGRVSSIGETFNSIRDKLNPNMRLLFEKIIIISANNEEYQMDFYKRVSKYGK